MSDEQPQPNTIYNLAGSPAFANDGVCFAAGMQGLKRSQDGGYTWTDVLAVRIAVPALVISPTFVADHGLFAGSMGGILCSGDGGETWRVEHLPSPPPYVVALAVSPDYAHDGTVFAGTMEDGVFCSRNRGYNWYTWNFGLLDLNVLALAVSPDFGADETVFAAVESGVFRSTNGGRAWRESSFPIDDAPVISLAISPGFGTDHTLFAGTEAHGLFKSVDRGKTWQRLAAQAIGDSVDAILFGSNFATALDLLVLGDGRLSVSGDGGASWQPWPVPAGIEGEITAVLAPTGLAAGSALLVGLADGRVRRV
jgi:photosystem II stability/assembly factor-like uncharacterized protein